MDCGERGGRGRRRARSALMSWEGALAPVTLLDPVESFCAARAHEQAVVVELVHRVPRAGAGPRSSRARSAGPPTRSRVSKALRARCCTRTTPLVGVRGEIDAGGGLRRTRRERRDSRWRASGRAQARAERRAASMAGWALWLLARLTTSERAEPRAVGRATRSRWTRLSLAPLHR